MLKEGKCATHLEAYPARVTWAQEATLYANGLLALPPPLGPCRLFLCFCNGRGELQMSCCQVPTDDLSLRPSEDEMQRFNGLMGEAT